MLEYNLEETLAIQKKSMAKLVRLAGNSNHLAKMLNIDNITTYGWARRGRISKKGARLVESHPVFGKLFKAEDLRPDLDY